ncbi:MAG: Hpt domain-containing protein [Gammaproteobacteria bacterium]|nr:Hpt domain-containing protein [Gammaproteobacteria bacterium]
MEKIFDATLAIEQAGGNEELARELFSMFLNELDEHRQTIKQALEHFKNGNLVDILWDPVHKLHGATAYLGVPSLRRACQELEALIKQEIYTDIVKATTMVFQEIDRLSHKGADVLQQDWY